MNNWTPAMVKEARRKLGFSQVELAEAIGVQSRTVQRWESGEIPLLGSAEKMFCRLLQDKVIADCLDALVKVFEEAVSKAGGFPQSIPINFRADAPDVNKMAVGLFLGVLQETTGKNLQVLLSD